MSDLTLDGVPGQAEDTPVTGGADTKMNADDVFAILMDVLGVTVAEEALLSKASAVVAERILPKIDGSNDSSPQAVPEPDAWQFKTENGQWIPSTAPTNSAFDVKYRHRFRPLYTMSKIAKVQDLALVARPISEYEENMGDVLWWKFPIEEAPYVGSPLDVGITVEAHTTTRIITQCNQEHDPEPTIERIDVGGWPGYHTHFTQIITPNTPPVKIATPEE